MSDDESSLDQDEVLAELRASLREWLIDASVKGIDHVLCVTALALFTASGAASAGITKKKLVETIELYYDMYANAARKRDRDSS